MKQYHQPPRNKSPDKFLSMRLVGFVREVIAIVLGTKPGLTLVKPTVFSGTDLRNREQLRLGAGGGRWPPNNSELRLPHPPQHTHISRGSQAKGPPFCRPGWEFQEKER